jgi:hypothetical protein
MLDFIFRYTWLAMLIIAYIIWTFVSIKDIKKNSSSFMSASTETWVIVTVFLVFAIIATPFVMSLTYFCFY